MEITRGNSKENKMLKTILTIAIVYASMFAGARVGPERMNRSAEVVIETIQAGCEFVADKTKAADKS